MMGKVPIANMPYPCYNECGNVGGDGMAASFISQGAPSGTHLMASLGRRWGLNRGKILISRGGDDALDISVCNLRSSRMS